MKNNTDRGAVMQDIDKTLRTRFIAPMVAFIKSFRKEVQKQISRADKGELRSIERKLYAGALKRPGQWHRWHKANSKHQRRLTAMRRLGFKMNPEKNFIPRYAVW